MGQPFGILSHVTCMVAVVTPSVLCNSHIVPSGDCNCVSVRLQRSLSENYPQWAHKEIITLDGGIIIMSGDGCYMRPLPDWCMIFESLHWRLFLTQGVLQLFTIGTHALWDYWVCFGDSNAIMCPSSHVCYITPHRLGYDMTYRSLMYCWFTTMVDSFVDTSPVKRCLVSNLLKRYKLSKYIKSYKVFWQIY